jgi:hypothetical protein
MSPCELQMNAARYTSRPLPALAVSLAEDEYLANVESFTDWLYDQCCHQPPVSLRVPSDPVELQQMFDDADVPVLVALLLYPRQEVIARASSELKDRYLKEFESALLDRAGEIANDLEEHDPRDEEAFQARRDLETEEALHGVRA